MQSFDILGLEFRVFWITVHHSHLGQVPLQPLLRLPILWALVDSPDRPESDHPAVLVVELVLTIHVVQLAVLDLGGWGFSSISFAQTDHTNYYKYTSK